MRERKRERGTEKRGGGHTERKGERGGTGERERGGGHKERERALNQITVLIWEEMMSILSQY